MTHTIRRLGAAIFLFGAASPAIAQSCAPPSTGFEESFDGGFESPWDTFTFADGVSFLGFPPHDFVSFNGEDSIRLSPTLGPGQFVGMNPQGYCFSADTQYVEIRFQVRDISAGGLLGLRIVSPSGRYFEIGVGGFSNAEMPRFYCDHWNLDDPLIGNLPLFPDTWYSLRIIRFPAGTTYRMYDEDGNQLAGVGCGTVFEFDDLEEFGFGIFPQVRVWLSDDNIPTTTEFLVDHVRVVTEPCVADTAPPFFTLDFNDVVAFLDAFATMDPLADIAPPFGVWDFNDVVAFLTLFAAGCP